MPRRLPRTGWHFKWYWYFPEVNNPLKYTYFIYKYEQKICDLRALFLNFKVIRYIKSERLTKKKNENENNNVHEKNTTIFILVWSISL